MLILSSIYKRYMSLFGRLGGLIILPCVLAAHAAPPTTIAYQRMSVPFQNMIFAHSLPSESAFLFSKVFSEVWNNGMAGNKDDYKNVSNMTVYRASDSSKYLSLHKINDQRILIDSDKSMRTLRPSGANKQSQIILEGPILFWPK